MRNVPFHWVVVCLSLLGACAVDERSFGEQTANGGSPSADTGSIGGGGVGGGNASGGSTDGAGGGVAGAGGVPLAPACSTAEPGQYVCENASVVACGQDRTSTTPVEVCYACRSGECYCPRGTSVSGGEGAARCQVCSGGTFSAADDASECAAFRDCGAGQFVLTQGTESSDRECGACSDGTFTAVLNAEACAAWQTCGAGQFVSQPGTPAGNRQCTDCPNGSFNANPNASSCTTWQACAAGEFVSQQGTPINNRACARCDVGTVSSTANAPACLVAQIEAGGSHTCALTTGGGVRCWGSAFFGQLGYGNTEDVGDDETPASVGNVNVGGTALQIATGSAHTCALLSNGNVRCWGDGDSGRLGNLSTELLGDNEPAGASSTIDIGGTVRQISAGTAHTCALLTDGNVRCWGSGSAGRLGYGNTADIGDNETPASAGNVAVGGAVAQIAAGSSHTCALLTDGNVRCWGDGFNGRLGYGNTIAIGDNETPASAGNVPLGGTVTQIAVGDSHSCALLTSGDVRCWGANSGRLGYGNVANIGDNETPASAGDVDVGGTVAQIAAGNGQTCALLTDGNVRCWGDGSAGRLGYGDTFTIGDDELPSSTANVDVGGTVTQVTAGDFHTCALLTNGNVRCWGNNVNAELGYGNGTDENIGDDEAPASAGNVPYL